MSERRLSFGAVAELYDRVRPSYPDALVEDVIEDSRGERALEIGAGTGKATVLFAERGVEVLALEPSAEMAAVARRNCGGYPRVRVQEIEFEQWEPGEERFGLLYAAQAWHWVAPEERYRRAGAALDEGGLLAAFWNRVSWAECELRDGLGAAYDRAGADVASNDPMDPRRSADIDWPVRWGREIERASGFGEPRTRVYRWDQEYSTAGYVELLRTHSIQLVREAAVREALLGAVGEAIGTRGGRIVIPYATELCLARVTRRP